MSAPGVEGPTPDILDRLDGYTTFDAETEFQIIRRLDGAVMVTADWVRYGEAVWQDMRDARDEIARLRATLST